MSACLNFRVSKQYPSVITIILAKGCSLYDNNNNNIAHSASNYVLCEGGGNNI